MLRGSKGLGGFWEVSSHFDMHLDSGHTVAVLANYDPLIAHHIASKLRELLTQTSHTLAEG